MKTPLNLIALSALAGLLSVSCNTTRSATWKAADPLPDPGPLPAWTQTKGKPNPDGTARQVRIETKFIEVTHEDGSGEVATKRYQKRMNQAERQKYVRAMSMKKGADLLSTPSVVAREGQTANIEIAREFIHPKDPRNPSGEKQTEMVGVSSFFRAQPVSGGKKIKLDVLGQVKEFKGWHEIEPGVIEPVFDTRRLGSTVSLASGETMVFGGLGRVDHQQVEDKVPFLGDLPLIGRLFRSSQTITFNRNLVMMVTPTVIDEKGVAAN